MDAMPVFKLAWKTTSDSGNTESRDVLEDTTQQPRYVGHLHVLTHRIFQPKILDKILIHA